MSSEYSKTLLKCIALKLQSSPVPSKQDSSYYSQVVSGGQNLLKIHAKFCEID